MRAARLVVLACTAFAAPALADTLIYSTDFESGAGPEWSVSTTTTAAPFTRFLGRFSHYEAAELLIPAIPPPGPPLLGSGSTGTGTNTGGGAVGGSTGGSTGGGAGNSGFPYLLVFDFYCIDSWDGYAAHGPDRLVISINQVKMFDHTFSNQHEFQSYPYAPTVGPAHMGFNSLHKDSIYRDIAIPFDPGSAEMIKVRFYGEVMQGPADESWGIDNVRVYYAPVPTPGTLALLGAGGVFLSRRRR
jgi:hypothetical protein